MLYLYYMPTFIGETQPRYNIDSSEQRIMEEYIKPPQGGGSWVGGSFGLIRWTHTVNLTGIQTESFGHRKGFRDSFSSASTLKSKYFVQFTKGTLVNVEDEEHKRKHRSGTECP